MAFSLSILLQMLSKVKEAFCPFQRKGNGAEKSTWTVIEVEKKHAVIDVLLDEGSGLFCS